MHPEAFQIKSRVCVCLILICWHFKPNYYQKLLCRSLTFYSSWHFKKSLDESCRYPETSATDATSIQIST